MAYIRLNRENFYHNLNQIALKTGSVDKIAMVLKDNAYGHGIEQMAQLASEFGIKHAVVGDHTEAAQINRLFDTVLILGGEIVTLDNCSYAINHLDAIVTIPQGTKVELKIDTGMHRNGISIDEIGKALALIQKQGLEIVGVMTHYRSADLLSSEFFWQQKQFKLAQEQIKAAGFGDIRVHSHASAALLRSKRFDEDMARVGIAAYGYSELGSTFDDVALKPVLSLYASRVSTRRVKKGDRVGYGGTFTAPEDMEISTYDIGYGDGWCRGDSDHPYITPDGLPILGRVSMDFISLQSNKEEICIMGDAREAARQMGTISYEMTTALMPDIKRIIT